MPKELCLLMSRNGHLKITVSIFLVVASILLIVTAVMEFRSSRIRRLEPIKPDFDPSYKRKYSVAVASSIDNAEVQYGVVIDCGSSGSRVFIYYWPPHNGNPKELLQMHHLRDKHGKQALKKITPGISEYAEKPAESSDYLRPLLDYAAKNIPANKHAETPLYIMATAGLRVLSKSVQDAILDDLRVDIPLEYKFMFVNTHAEVISGKQEGVYAWIAINYVQSKFEHSIGRMNNKISAVNVPGQGSSTHLRQRTIGIIDMGGGSLQIAYEVPQSVSFISGKEDVAKSLLAEFSLGCTASDLDHTYRVYVATFLGYGANSARKQHEIDLIKESVAGMGQTANKTHITSAPSGKEILDPCLCKNMADTVEYQKHKYIFRGTGNYDECRIRVAPLLNKTVQCSKEPCSMNGVFQPKIDFRNSEFYGFSEFFYTSEDILKIGGSYQFLKFNKYSKKYCETEWSTIETWIKEERYPRADFNRYRYQCFKSAWMATVFHEGLGFPKVYDSFTSAQDIRGKEVHWTLGALLYKTRYYPLSAIQQYISHHPRPPWVLEQLQHSTYIIIVCFFVVVASIFIYLRRLRIVRTPGLHKVPSMAYFMTEEGQAQDGVTVLGMYP